MAAQTAPSPAPCQRVYLAPLAGYTDLPFRRACRAQGCHYAFTALVDAGAMAYGNPHNETILRRGTEEPWLGTQLLGADPDLITKAARLLNQRQFEVVDFNLGCPVKKVTQRGAGAALGLQRDQAVRCVEALVQASVHPVTAKIRVLDDHDPEPTLALARALQQCGIRALTIHGRTVDRIYAGAVACRIIATVRESLSIPVIANGGIFSRQDAEALSRHTGCHQVMVARGAIGNPWLFRELLQPEAPPATHEELCTVLREHVEGMIELYGERNALRNARKIILAYLVGRGYPRELRGQVTDVSTHQEFLGVWREIRQQGPSSHYVADHNPGNRRFVPLP
ncbi:MAG: tRNA-dihydrouridine synthase family protein [Victivallales bacterium]|nr:tRNA-dihydrouridine synthase family protein [Victivallales bacterium]